jgi:hypothetical protein
MDSTNTIAVESQPRTTNGNTSTINLGGVQMIRAQLDVTAAAGTTPTLNIIFEDTLDSVNFNQIAAFTQKTGPGREVVNITVPFTESVRVRWTITGSGASFTFSVSMFAQTRRTN